MLRAKNVDMLHGNLFKTILIYSFPLFLISLIQNLFNAVDIMVLGAVADTSAVASVGATSPILHLLINAFFGISTGAKVVLARLLGAQKHKRTAKTVSTAMITALSLGLLTAIVGFLFTPAFLRLTNCPAECFRGALIYMRIYVLASPVLMIYNFGSAILQVSGDSQRPLYYMIISGGLNVVLNFALCMFMSEKVAAVAIATAVSQLAGAALVLLRLFRMDGPCRLNLRALHWSNAAFGKIMKNGIPIALSSALFPLANLQIQSAINSFGAATMAGNSAAISLEALISTATTTPWASSATVFVGQNLGAKDQVRVKKTILYTLALSMGLSLVLCNVGFLFSRQLLSLYVSEEAAIAAGRTRLFYILLPYAIGAINTVLGHVIQAFGYSMFSTVNSIVSVLLFRMVWMAWIYPLYPTYACLCQCYLVSWFLILIINVSFTLYLYFGKLKKGLLTRMS